MAAFASDRRSGWVRFVVLLLCALFIFATLGAPAAHALAVESSALFGLAAVLSAATAALGFKLSSSAEGQATLAKMMQDFKAVAWATGLVIVGSKVNGLVHGMDYIKMQIKNGKTYLDSRVVAWVQQWLAGNGVYNSGSISQKFPILNNKININFANLSFTGPTVDFDTAFNSLVLNSKVLSTLNEHPSDFEKLRNLWNDYPTIICSYAQGLGNFSAYCWIDPVGYAFVSDVSAPTCSFDTYQKKGESFYVSKYGTITWSSGGLYYKYNNEVVCVSNFLLTENNSNDTGLSGTDTLGKDVVDLTLDQILQRLNEWAQDWFDAGADSATNAAAGAVDLPLTVTAGAASANPALNPDVVYNPPFSLPVPDVRSGSTSSDEVDAGKANADTAVKTEETTATVSENQSVIDGIVNWALDYISPDTGMFSKFPLCVPYDMYLLSCSVLGIDPPLSDIQIFTQNPETAGSAAVSSVADDDWQPVIHIQNYLKLDDRTVPIDLTVDLSKWNDIMHDVRIMVTIYIIGCLIAAEMWRLSHGGV